MGQRGQASLEWLALVLVAACLVLAAGAVAGGGLTGIGRGWPARLGLSHASDPRIGSPAVEDRATWAVVRRVAPGLVFERGFADVPVDPRVCRARACMVGARPVLFTHVVRRGAVTYVQYWAYYPDSSWNGVAGFHRDDWESFQVRVLADGTVQARASAHHGYTGKRIGPDLNLNQVGSKWVPERWRGGWTASTGWLRVAKGSHAGYVARAPLGRRFVAAQDVTLVPIETAGLPEGYAIAPPWRKRVYTDPESPAT